MTTPLSLSVALASYNGERYIGAQLDSIARQTRLPDELVICDDASTDSTEDIVREFARRAPFAVRFFQHERMGSSTRNFELAIAECRGDIIFLCDQDDVWYPNKVETIEAVFIDRPETGAVFTDADVVDENLQPLGSRLWTYFRFRPKEQAQVEAGDALACCSGIRWPLAQPWPFVPVFAIFCYRCRPRGTTRGSLCLSAPYLIWLHCQLRLLLIGSTAITRSVYRVRAEIGIKQSAEIYAPRVLLYEKARARLLEFTERFPMAAQGIYRFDEKLSFLRACAALPRARWRRLPGTLRELILLRYHSYARGLTTFCRDLLG